MSVSVDTELRAALMLKKATIRLIRISISLKLAIRNSLCRKYQATKQARLAKVPGDLGKYPE